MPHPAGAIALVLCFCCALSSSAEGRRSASASAGGGKGKKLSVSGRGERGRSGKRGGKRKRPPAPPPMPTRLEVLSIEPKTGSVRVGLDMPGPTKPPESRLFVLTDERGRRFVPATADCTSSEAAHAQAANAPADSSTPVHWQCELSIAPLYRRAALTGVAMEWGERVISALPGQVRARWAEGPTSHPAPPPSSDAKPQPDAGTAPPPAGENEPGSNAPPGEDDEESEPE